MVVDKQEALDRVAQMVADCQRCFLYKTAKRSVSGQGNPDAKVFFIGEAPGFNEDQQGVPFCGRAGKLLEKFLELASLTREEVFIANMLRHRPPSNRDPSEAEIAACRPFLDRQIEVIEPKVIVTLGRFSMEKFLPGSLISRVHGQPRFVNFSGKEYIVFPMYHPAASLRNGKIKALEEKDFVKLGQFLAKLNQVQEKTGQNLSKHLSSQDKSEKQMKLI
ncbi:MAG: uracil-DNA glycosylase [Candidatus Shapirobacteria bacterium]|nr:uracil-DNA glycosylase [Candidatus Shapirobacteria bacterium]MDD5073685.1 uracil-DNA glycosylase [Candidatus Shapirobacteria bacterium]MDD5481447.1 uracil-DNA glycosylase [Candidatus Shapirobacteria bacterium]